MLVPSSSPLPLGSGSGHGLVRPSNTVLPSIKIQRMGLSPATPPSFTFLTSLWTPRICIFIGSGGQVDEFFRIIYPRVPVSLTEAPTCPCLHPHLGSSRPVKLKHRERGMWVRREERGVLMNSQISSPLSVLCVFLADDSTKCSKWYSLKKPQGFPWVFCLQSLRSAWLTPRPSESARAMRAIFCSSLFNQYISLFAEVL